MNGLHAFIALTIGMTIGGYVGLCWQEKQNEGKTVSSEKQPINATLTYPFPHGIINGRISDLNYPGTACERLVNVLKRLSSLPNDVFIDLPWPNVRSHLLWCGGLKEDRSTTHAFNDDNHCDLTTMADNVQENRNSDGRIEQISRKNFLGDHIKAASLPELGEGGSWSTCTNGCHKIPPHDVAHAQFHSRVAFKLVWCPPEFEKFVLVDDEGKLLKVGRPDKDYGMPHKFYRKGNYELTKGGKYATAAEKFCQIVTLRDRQEL